MDIGNTFLLIFGSIRYQYFYHLFIVKSYTEYKKQKQNKKRLILSATTTPRDCA